MIPAAWIGEFIYNDGTGLDNGSVAFGDRVFDLTPDNANERLFMCAGYNVLAFRSQLDLCPAKGRTRTA